MDSAGFSYIYTCWALFNAKENARNTKTSFTTTTAMMREQNGPEPLTSFITARADAGDRATAQPNDSLKKIGSKRHYY